jgi:hypothetical protein
LGLLVTDRGQQTADVDHRPLRQDNTADVETRISMKPDEMSEVIAAREAAAAGQHAVLFMPFLRLKKGYKAAGVDFLPLRDSDGQVSEVLRTAEGPLLKILSGYVDRDRKPFTNCVVATIEGRGWDLKTDEDFETVRWAASLLFFAAWACNEYFARFGGTYVNSAEFRLIGQAYEGDMPGSVAISSRRGDGKKIGGGYQHGELKFAIPFQCSVRDAATVDEPFLAALDAISRGTSPILDRLTTSLPFVELANTDEDFMTVHNEAILMASAFEQLFNGNGEKHRLVTRFGDAMQEFGNITVADAQKVRPDIRIDTSDPARAAAQPTWWVHKKWIEELYDVRSKVVHKGTPDSRSWGWSVFEHLAMAAHVFPLAVKTLLANDGLYTLSDTDRARGLSVDKLLAAAQWADDRDAESSESWSRIESRTRRDVAWEKVWKAVRAEHPDLFKESLAEGAN